MRDFNVTKSSKDEADALLRSLRERADFESVTHVDCATWEAVGGGKRPESWWSVVCSVPSLQEEGE